MVAIFGDFLENFDEKMAFFSKINAMIIFLQKLAVVRAKMPIFSQFVFAKKFKILATVPHILFERV
jgi:hypothetical protein